MELDIGLWRDFVQRTTARSDFVVSQDGDIRAVKRVGSRTYLFDNVKVLSTFDDDLRMKLAAVKGSK